jgi:hypothetical protein
MSGFYPDEDDEFFEDADIERHRPPPRRQNNVVVGKRVQLPLDSAGTAVDVTDASGWRDLVRGNFAGGTMWQVTLAPVEQVRANPAATLPFTADPLLRLQFGGGGVATELLFNWPLLGASFVLPAESLTLDVRGTNAAVLLAGSGAPVVSAWLLRGAKPTYPSSLFSNSSFAANPVTLALLPFAKRVHVGAQGGAFLRVEFLNFAGVVIARTDIADTRYYAVPVPSDAQQVRVTGDAVNPWVLQELSFT